MSDSPLPWSPAPAAAEIAQRRLLQCIVEVARGVFGAAAASVFLLDEPTGDLVFEAVSGEGEQRLVGTRFPGGTGIAGWVVFSGQPLLVDDLSGNPQFAQDAAASTGYIPNSIMAAPLISGGACLGVLEILDRGSGGRGELADVDLLGLLAAEVTMALDLLVRLRGLAPGALPGAELAVAGHTVPGADGAGPALPGSAGPGMPLLHRVAARLPAASERVAGTVTRLLAMADELLAEDVPVASPARA